MPHRERPPREVPPREVLPREVLPRGLLTGGPLPPWQPAPGRPDHSRFDALAPLRLLPSALQAASDCRIAANARRWARLGVDLW